MPCKAVTLYPIWAWAVIYGPKRIENRSWPTRYRGRLAIHAGTNRRTLAADRLTIESLGVAVPATLPESVIIGTVDLVDCQPYTDALRENLWACGPWCWILDNPRAFSEPIPAVGKLSLWTCQLPVDEE